MPDINLMDLRSLSEAQQSYFWHLIRINLNEERSEILLSMIQGALCSLGVDSLDDMLHEHVEETLVRIAEVYGADQVWAWINNFEPKGPALSQLEAGLRFRLSGT